MKFARSLACEFMGSAFLLATVVGSGILADRLDGGTVGLSVLCVAFATGMVLTALILSLGGISCHLNPVVTLVTAVRRQMPWNQVLPFVLVQIAGACAGVVLANLMFELPAVTISETARAGYGQWIGEVMATFGLILTIWGCGKFRPEATPFAVGGYVAGAIWFTSSTCFANPAVTVGRMLTNTLTGIQPACVPAYVLFQVVAAAAAIAICAWLFHDEPETRLVFDRQDDGSLGKELTAAGGRSISK